MLMPGRGAAGAGRDLARLIFGGAEAGTGMPTPLGAVIGRPDTSRAWDALDGDIEERLEADPGLASAAGPRQLGELLWAEEPELARTALERALSMPGTGTP